MSIRERERLKEEAKAVEGIFISSFLYFVILSTHKISGSLFGGDETLRKDYLNETCRGWKECIVTREDRYWEGYWILGFHHKK